MRKKLLVVIIILVVLILCGGIGYTYFFTDILKSDKELFAKYISQNSELLEFLEDEDLENYNNKQQNYAYTSSGSIQINNSDGITFSSDIEDQLETVELYCDLVAEAEVEEEENSETTANDENSTTEEEEEAEELDSRIINAIKEEIEYENVTINATYLEEGNSTIVLTYSDGSTAEGILNDGEIIWGSVNLASRAYSLANSSITFTTNTDKANNYVYKNVNLNYSNEESLNLEYINNQDYYGVKIDDVVNKYITVQNNNLKEFAEILELDEEEIEAIPDKIDFDGIFSSSLFTDEELSELKSTYTNVLLENLTDDMFSQSETASEEIKIYTLQLNEKQVLTIFVKLLEQVKQDEIIINKISEIIAEQTSYSETEIEELINNCKDQLQEYIDEINEEITNITINESAETDSEDLITINVYVNNKTLTKTEILVDSTSLNITKSDEGYSIEYKESEGSSPFSVNLNKTKTTDSIDYSINCTNNNTQIFNLDISFSGLSSLEQVTEKSTFAFNYDEYSLSYTYNNTKNFVSQISQDVTTDDMLILNTASSLDSIENLFEQISERLEEVNSEQMSNLGIDENPMIYYIPSAVSVLGVYGLQVCDNSTGLAAMTATTGTAFGILIYNNAKNTVDSTTLDSLEQDSFNSQFTAYTGSDVSGYTVTVLISSVTASNASESSYNDTPRLIDVVYIDEETNEEIDLLEAETITDYISTDEYYYVSEQYGNDGYLNKLIINIE